MITTVTTVRNNVVIGYTMFGPLGSRPGLEIAIEHMDPFQTTEASCRAIQKLRWKRFWRL